MAPSEINTRYGMGQGMSNVFHLIVELLEEKFCVRPRGVCETPPAKGTMNDNT